MSVKWIPSHPPVSGFHQYTPQLSAVRDGRGNWFGSIKNITIHQDTVICFHEDPVIKDVRAIQVFLHEKKTLRMRQREILKEANRDTKPTLERQREKSGER